LFAVVIRLPCANCGQRAAFYRNHIYILPSGMRVRFDANQKKKISQDVSKTKSAARQFLTADN
jgi:hypothetical protein